MRFALSLLLIAAPAFAAQADPGHQAPHQAAARKHEARAPAREPVAHRAAPARKVDHATQCRRTYPNYNPKTGRYTVRPGVTRRCAL